MGPIESLQIRPKPVVPHARLLGLRLGLLVAVWAAGQGVECLAQRMEGRVDVTVLDPSGRGIEARVEIASRMPKFAATARADSEGRAVLHRIPPGVYRVTAEHAGFETAEQRIEVRSSVPQSVRVVMEIAALRQAVTVAAAPLFDPLNPSPVVTVGRQDLDRMLGTTLGRSTVDVVTTMPGWLLEANAVLHPRGSEYDTQYVIDGMPIYDNRSIAFAPAFENSEFEAVNVRTAGIPGRVRAQAWGRDRTGHAPSGSPWAPLGCEPGTWELRQSDRRADPPVQPARRGILDRDARRRDGAVPGSSFNGELHEQGQRRRRQRAIRH